MVLRISRSPFSFYKKEEYVDEQKTCGVGGRSSGTHDSG